MKQTNQKSQSQKLIWIFPAIVLALLSVSCSEDYLEDQQVEQKSNSIDAVGADDGIQSTDMNPDVPFALIEQVPTYPGCDGDNRARKNCMSKSIQQFINENFDTAIANELNLKGPQRIIAQFTIDESGKVAQIHTRAQSPELQAEAERVINMLPKMEPGTQKGQEVGVIYALPIIFEVAG